MKRVTFKILCERLALYLKEEDFFRIIVPVQGRITMSLHKLDSDDGL